MKTYLILFTYTADGIKAVKDAPNRIKESKEKMKAWGVEVVADYALFGKYDFAWIVKAVDDKTMGKVDLYFGSRGFVRSETFPAFTEAEFIDIVEHLPA